MPGLIAIAGPGFQPLTDLADWFGSVIEFDDPDSVDWDDPAAVVKEAFTASDCGNFSLALSEMTGWPIYILGGADGPVHALVKAPDGRLLDATGWTDLATLAKRYGVRCLSKCPEGTRGMATDPGAVNDEGINEEMARVVSAVRALPWAPFNTTSFRKMALRPLRSVDAPEV